MYSPTPPPLPPGEVRAVPGRGELFVRQVHDAPAGDALPVVLIHGWQATADLNFFPLYQPLGERRPVVAADLRGHGRSLYPETAFSLEAAADDNAALVRDLGLERVVVLGYSIGTAVAQTMVDRHPDLVAGLVLVGGEFRPRQRMSEKVYDRIGGWLATTQRATAGRRGAHAIVTKAAVENRDVESLRGWLTAEMERGHAASMRQAGRALARFDGGPIAEAHAVPTAVVVTTRDRLVRPERQERLAEGWRATIVQLDADHDAPLTQPAAFVNATLEGLDAVDALMPATVTR